MAGRPPKPLALHVADGTYRDDRHGGTANAPGTPSKPSWMQPEAVSLWDRVVPELMSINVVGSIDEWVLQRLCETWVLYRRALSSAEMDPCHRDARTAVATYGKMVDYLLNQLGMSPGGRMRLALERNEKPVIARRQRPTG